MASKPVFRVGDLVEAIWLGDRKQKRKGMITCILGDGSFRVDLLTTSSLCIKPKKIPKIAFTQNEIWWLNSKLEEKCQGERLMG